MKKLAVQRPTSNNITIITIAVLFAIVLSNTNIFIYLSKLHETIMSNETYRTGSDQQLTTGQLTHDPTSILKLSDTREVIENIFYDLCGLKKITRGDNTYIIRITKPKTTYEFANDLQTLLFTQSNKVTARTDYTAMRLGNFFALKSDTLCDHFAIHGFNAFITEKAWKAIKELARINPSETPDSNGYTPNLWQTKYGIHWEYDLPVSQDMLEIVKEQNDLSQEEAGQSAELRELFWSIMIFLEGSLNKSKEHLSLDHEKQTISERTTHNTVPIPYNPEHKKNSLMRMFGG